MSCWTLLWHWELTRMRERFDPLVDAFVYHGSSVPTGQLSSRLIQQLPPLKILPGSSLTHSPLLKWQWMGTWIALSPLRTCQVLARLSKEGCIFAASASPDLCIEGLDFQVCQHWHGLHGFPSNAMNFNYRMKRGGPIHLSPAIYQKSWFRIADCSSCQISFILNHCHLGVALHLEN